jgi:hypothetical protein
MGLLPMRKPDTMTDEAHVQDAITARCSPTGATRSDPCTVGAVLP